MKIKELFTSGKPVFSFEFFPPKNEASKTALYHTIAELRALEPSFVSVTYGAGGATRQHTLEVVLAIHRELNLTVMAHLTCVGSSPADIDTVLTALVAAGVENVLALRGDPPQGETTFAPTPEGYRYAAELVGHIRASYDLCLGVAGYPEGHPECADKQADLDHLKLKVDAGADFVVTQLFFDNTDFFAFCDRARSIGITVPIIPGIMPVTNRRQVEKFTSLCGARIPNAVMNAIDRFGDDTESLTAFGIDYAIRQCQDLLAGGAQGIHLYTLNKSTASQAIVRELKN